MRAKKKVRAKKARARRAKEWARRRTKMPEIRVTRGGASTATGRDTLSPTVHRRSSTTKSSSLTDNVMLVTVVATAEEHEVQ